MTSDPALGSLRTPNVIDESKPKHFPSQLNIYADANPAQTRIRPVIAMAMKWSEDGPPMAEFPIGTGALAEGIVVEVEVGAADIDVADVDVADEL